MKKKARFVFAMLLISASTINAQNSVHFNRYGTYLVQNGITKEINTEYESVISGGYFWENFLVLVEMGPLSYIYNIETGTISHRIDGNIKKLERKNNLVAYIAGDQDGYWVYEFKPNTLALTNKEKLASNPFPDLQRTSYLYDYFEGNNHSQITTREKMNDQLYRYNGANFYLDIHYDFEIDINASPVSGGKNNIFLVAIYQILADER
jgi:hypothetical protein